MDYIANNLIIGDISQILTHEDAHWLQTYLPIQISHVEVDFLVF